MNIRLKPLPEQVIVVTGASSGIGLVTALSAAKRGAKVILAARSSEALRRIVNEINASNQTAIAVTTDVCSFDQIRELAQEAVSKYGRIDTWINNAATSIYGRMLDVSDADNRKLFDTNFWGIVYGSQVAVEHLRSGGGALINVGSEVSEAIVPLQGMYTASKHAIKGFTDVLRVELEIEQAPISVTLIQPTAVNTPFPQNARNYMENEPKLPDPKIDPQQVADAILDAAENPARDVKVGATAKINTALSYLTPTLSDKIAKRVAGQQHYDIPPIRAEGSLYEPSNCGRTHGAVPAGASR